MPRFLHITVGGESRLINLDSITMITPPRTRIRGTDIYLGEETKGTWHPDGTPPENVIIADQEFKEVYDYLLKSGVVINIPAVMKMDKFGG